MSNDPFAFLRSLLPSAPASPSSDASGTVDSSAADPVESDLFSGSEPVPTEPETAAPAEAATPASTVPSFVDTFVASAGANASIPAFSGDVFTAVQAALIDLDNRVKVIETYLKQNGVL